MAKSGESVGAYRLIEPIGRSDVWKAESDSGPVVVLRLLPDADVDHAERLARDVATLGKVAHPNIASVLDSGRSGDALYVVTEHVEGASIDGRGAMDPTTFFHVAIPLASAVAAANDRGLIHGNLSPHNVVVTSDGAIRVVDYCSRTIRDGESMTGSLPEDAPTETLTHEREIDLRALPFCSPERVQSKPLDVRADTYSLGAVLYELATGRAPFSGDTSADLMVAVLRDLPPPIRDTNPALPAELDRIVGRALVKNRSKRLQSSRFLLEDLERLNA